MAKRHGTLSPSMRRRALANRVRAIKEALRRNDCYRAEALFTDMQIRVEHSEYGVAPSFESFSSLLKRVRHCHRRKRG